MRRILFAVALFILGAVACAQAAIIYTSVTPQELVDLLGEYGVKGNINEDNVTVVRDGEKSFYFINDNNDSIQFYVGYEVDIPLEKVNDFNNKYRYAKCIRRLGSDKKPFVSMEIDFSITGGVTKENIFDFFRIIDSSLDKYHELINS